MQCPECGAIHIRKNGKRRRFDPFGDWLPAGGAISIALMGGRCIPVLLPKGIKLSAKLNCLIFWSAREIVLC